MLPQPFERMDIMAVSETVLIPVTPTANVKSKRIRPAIPIAAIFPKLCTVSALQKCGRDFCHLFHINKIFPYRKSVSGMVQMEC